MKFRTIRAKLLLPIFTVLILASVAGLLTLQPAISDMMNAQLDSTRQLSDATLKNTAAAKIKEINGNIERIAQKALEQASILASTPGVVDAYQLAYRGDIHAEADPDLQTAREQLRLLFSPVIENYKKTTGKKELKLHFHLPSNRSLVRLWREGWQTKRNGEKVDISDDLSGFRKTVTQISQGSHNPVSGIEIGRGGFAIRGLTPIRDENGTYLGSAEILLPFNGLLKVSRTMETQKYAVFMNAQHLSVATGLQNQERYPKVGKNFVLCAATDTRQTLELVTAEILSAGAKGNHFEQRGSTYITSFPIEDFSGTQVGVMVMQQDISKKLATFSAIEDKGKQSLNRIQSNTALGAGIIVLIVGSIVWFVTRVITRPVTEAVNVTQAIAAGDLGKRVKYQSHDEIGTLSQSLNSMCDSLEAKIELAKAIAAGDLTSKVELASEYDEFGRALQEMVSGLNTMVAEINAASEQIVSGSSQVSDVSQYLSQGATEQAASIEEITSSMEEISGQTRQNSDNAATASKLSQEARSAAETGDTNMEQMVAAMTEINSAGHDISKIIKVIDEIAFQTNLLALNAAVEAARAGQHGKGFAVVAEEVRNLAARSAKAASETAELIKSSVEKADNGVKIAEITAESLQQINEGIGKVDTLINEISTAAKEQAEGIAQVNEGLSQIDQVTQQNTASAEEGAASAEELSSQAQHLRSLLVKFKVKETSTSLDSEQHPRLLS